MAIHIFGESDPFPTAPDGTYDVRDYGALGTGGDDSAGFLAALTAMPSTGGTVQLPPSTTFLLSNIVMPNRQNVEIIGHPSTILKKNANGPMFTTPGSGWGERLTFQDVAMDGNGANFSGPGIVIGDSTAHFEYNKGRIMNMASHCVDFGDEGNGAQGEMNGTYLGVYLGGFGQASTNVAAIKLPNDTGQSGDRTFLSVKAFGCLLFDDYGTENTQWNGCRGRQFTMANAAAGYPHKTVMANSRFSSMGSPIKFRGTQNAVSNNVFAAEMRIEGNAANGAYSANVIAGDLIADAGTAGNRVSGNVPVTGVQTDNGANTFT